MYKDKIVWITGASSGIGEALAYQFAKEGAILILSARRMDRLEGVKAKCVNPEKVTLVPLDISDTQKIPSIAQSVIQKFGRIDVLVNNAGIGQNGTAVDTTLDVLRQVMEVNFFGQVALTKEVLLSMKSQKSGQICVISSVAGKLGLPKSSTYCASKHALHGYFDSLRSEVWKDNISICIICPGYVKSEISEHALGPSGVQTDKKNVRSVKRMDTEIAAKQMISALKRGKEEANVGGIETKSIFLKRHFPRFTSWLLKKVKV